VPTLLHRLAAALLSTLLAPIALARGQSVELAHGDPLRPNSWELLAVTLTAPPGGGTVGLRDARGGPLITRTIPQGSANPRILLPLPAINAADLPDGRWPLELTITGADRLPHTRRIDVPLPEPAAAPALRLALLTDMDTLPPAVGALGVSRPELVHVSEDDLLNGPALLFASVDAIYLPHRLMQNFPEERAAALTAAGARLLATEDDEAGLAALRRLAWVHVNRPDGATAADPLWAFPALPMHRLTPVQAGLANIPGFLAPPPADSRTRVLVAVVPLEALVALLLLYGMFRREWVILSVGIPVMIGLSALLISVLHAHAPDARRQRSWIAGGSGLRMEESVSARTTLFPQAFSTDAQDGEILCPLWPSAAACLGQRGVRLELDLPSESGIGRQSLLDARLGDREGVAFLRRLGHTDISFRAKVAIDVGRLDPTAAAGAWWIVGGHLDEARGDPPAAPTNGPTFAEWLPAHRDAGADARAWYELRFDARERYLLLTPPNEPPRFLTVSP
jgi:hypothetical protein